MKASCTHALRHNLGLKRDESVLVVTDGTREAVVTAFEMAARDLTPNVETVVIPVAERNGQEPPADVALRMKAADVVLMPVARSLSWTRARMGATEAGARIASMANIDEAIIDRTFTLDYQRVRRRVNRLCDLLDDAQRVPPPLQYVDVPPGVHGHGSRVDERALRGLSAVSGCSILAIARD